jgi:hypothetical protein
MFPPILPRLPADLPFGVAAVAGAMLLLELMATRIFSVLFFYHFSFFAVSLVMAGLAIGGIAVSRWPVKELSERVFRLRLAWLAVVFAAATLGALLVLVRMAPTDVSLSMVQVALRASVLLPGLVAAGAFLAAAFARNERWIGRLYAADLVAAAVACLAAIAVMRWLDGPAMLLVPAGLAALGGLVLAPRPTARTASVLALVLALGGIVLHHHDPRALRLQTEREPLIERWNEHSRIVAYRQGRNRRMMLIDRTAATFMRRLPAGPDGIPRIDPGWAGEPNGLAYRLGRPLHHVAIIGVGGGEDLLAPLARGAETIHGYELNSILVDLLRDDFRGFNAVAARPEVELIHQEARVGLAHSDVRYDVIQASLIDTWAATASGGFVLSESALYTVEGWEVFLDSLSDGGVLTMTRWLLPGAPAETQRLVALAAAALEEIGIADASRHVFLTGHRVGRMRDEFDPDSPVLQATILVSRAQFSPREVARLEGLAAELGAEVLLAPGRQAADPVLDDLVRPESRRRRIAGSPWDISPPTDERPYFFLQVRPRDVLRLADREFGVVTEITFNGVRVMLALTALVLLFTAVVLALTVTTLPGAGASAADRATYRRMSFYFLGLGFGYILLQLGLHQRLIIALGHPTLALSVVLFSMLIGTGLGSFASERLVRLDTMPRAWGAIVAMAAALWLAYPVIGGLERLDSSLLRSAAAGVVLLVTGFVLGFGFPLGVRLTAPTGQWAVQKMWAINGAASIAGAALAATLGVAFGSRTVIAAGVAAYLLAAVAGWTTWRRARDRPAA